MHINRIKRYIIVLAGLVFIGGVPVEFGNENSFFHGFVIPNPVIRIGLRSAPGETVVRSSSGMKVYEVGAGYELLGDDVEEARIKGEKERLTEKFVLLMAQTKDRNEAEQLAAGLRERSGLNVSVEEASESGLGGVFQVKIGDYLTRGDALSAISGLNAMGIKDIWILREVISLEEPGSRWVLIRNGLRPLAPRFGALFHPEPPRKPPFLQRPEIQGDLRPQGRAPGGGPHQCPQPRGLSQGSRPRRALSRPVRRDRGPQGPGGGRADVRDQEPRPVPGPRLRSQRYAGLPGLRRPGRRATPEQSGRGRYPGGGHPL